MDMKNYIKRFLNKFGVFYFKIGWVFKVRYLGYGVTHIYSYDGDHFRSFLITFYMKKNDPWVFFVKISNYSTAGDDPRSLFYGVRYSFIYRHLKLPAIGCFVELLLIFFILSLLWNIHLCNFFCFRNINKKLSSLVYNYFYPDLQRTYFKY